MCASPPSPPAGIYTVSQPGQPAGTSNGTPSAGSTGGAASNPTAATPPAASPTPAPASAARQTRRLREERREPAERRQTEPLFACGGSGLTETMRARLDALAAELAGREELRLAVVGRTDPQRLSAHGRAKYGDNHGLGLARARTAADHLAARLDLPADRIAIDSRAPPPANRWRTTPAPRAWRETGASRSGRATSSPAWWNARRWWNRPRPVAPPAPPRSCAELLACRAAAPELPFRNSIDGVPQDAPGVIDPDIQRCTDLSLAAGELQPRYDPLEQSPVLNAHAWPNAVAYGQPVTLRAWSNHADFIARAEIRLFAPGASVQGAPLAVLPVVPGGEVAWTPADRRLAGVD